MAKAHPKHMPSPTQIRSPVLSARFTPVEYQYVQAAIQRAGVGARRFILESVAGSNASFQRGFQAGRSLALGLMSPLLEVVCERCGQLVGRVDIRDPQIRRLVQSALASMYHPSCYRSGGSASLP
jgi:hypothetical protein